MLKQTLQSELAHVFCVQNFGSCEAFLCCV